MNTFLELLTTTGRFLVGLWPLMFLAVFVGITKRRKGFGEVARTSIKSLMVVWGFFALLNVVFFLLKMDTFSLLPKAVSTKYFLIVGLILAPLEFIIMLQDRKKLIDAETINEMQALSPSEFEKLVAQTYRAQGHRVEIVGSTGDHGIDLVVQTRKGETWLVQCKKYRGKVGEPIIRDFYGALRASNADAGAVITTGTITAQARLWAEGKPLYLYDGEEFLKIIETTRIRRSLPVELMKKQSDQPAAPAPVLQPAFSSYASTPAPQAAPNSTAPAASVLYTTVPAPSAAMAPETLQNVANAADAVVAETVYAMPSSTPAARGVNPAPYTSASAPNMTAPAFHNPFPASHFGKPFRKETDTYPLPDKRPFMDLNPAPDCPACGLPMILTTRKRYLLKPKEVYICQNAPSCTETHEVE